MPKLVGGVKGFCQVHLYFQWSVFQPILFAVNQLLPACQREKYKTTKTMTLPKTNSSSSLLMRNILIAILVIACVVAASSSHSSPADNANNKYQKQRNLRSVSEWVQEGHSQHQQLSSQSRQKRAPWDWSLDALKCSLKIISSQVSSRFTFFVLFLELFESDSSPQSMRQCNCLSLIMPFSSISHLHCSYK